MTDTIKLIRLQTGEDIVSKYTINNDMVLLDNPMHLILKRTLDKTVMFLIPWLPIEVIKNNVTSISIKNIITFVDIKDNLLDYYNKSVVEEQFRLLTDEKDLLKDINYFVEEDDDEEQNNNEIDDFVSNNNNETLH